MKTLVASTVVMLKLMLIDIFQLKSTLSYRYSDTYKCISRMIQYSYLEVMVLILVLILTHLTNLLIYIESENLQFTKYIKYI